jgi:hypothetical protein
LFFVGCAALLLLLELFPPMVTPGVVELGEVGVELEVFVVVPAVVEGILLVLLLLLLL